MSWFPQHLRRRRRLDSARTIVALHRALGGPYDAELHAELNRIEERSTATGSDRRARGRAAAAAAERLLSRAEPIGVGCYC